MISKVFQRSRLKLYALISIAIYFLFFATSKVSVDSSTHFLFVKINNLIKEEIHAGHWFNIRTSSDEAQVKKLLESRMTPLELEYLHCATDEKKSCTSQISTKFNFTITHGPGLFPFTGPLGHQSCPKFSANEILEVGVWKFNGWFIYMHTS